jgi:hypothetical protein
MFWFPACGLTGDRAGVETPPCRAGRDLARRGLRSDRRELPRGLRRNAGAGDPCPACGGIRPRSARARARNGPGGVHRGPGWPVTLAPGRENRSTVRLGWMPQRSNKTRAPQRPLFRVKMGGPSAQRNPPRRGWGLDRSNGYREATGCPMFLVYGLPDSTMIGAWRLETPPVQGRAQ